MVRYLDIAEEPVRKEVAMLYDVQIRHVPQHAFAAVCQMRGGATTFRPSRGLRCSRGGDFLDDPVTNGKELLQYCFLLRIDNRMDGRRVIPSGGMMIPGSSLRR